MDTVWVIILIVLAANVYAAVAQVLGNYVFDQMSGRWGGLFLLLWPVTYPLYIMVAVAAMIGSKEEVKR